MTTDVWQREAVHTPQIGVPVASDGRVKVALVLDNPTNAPAFGLVWQKSDSPLPQEWSWVGVGACWQLSTQWATAYVHADGTKMNGTYEEVLQQYGDKLVFDWLDKMNERLKEFFASDPANPPEAKPTTATLLRAMRSLEFVNGKIVKK